MPDYATLAVGLKDRSYNILVGSGVLSDADVLHTVFARYAGRKVVIIGNPTTCKLFCRQLTDSLPQCLNVLKLVIKDGEIYKNWQSLHAIYDFLLQNECNRDTVLCALGGGVVGDVVGFAAATYQRGIEYIQMPTTLLAQVDSAVGGKTAINHPLGKNMIGAFYQPAAVLSDTNTLATLPARQLAAGFAEVIKYALIGDEKFFYWLKTNSSALLQQDPVLTAQTIVACCRHKREIVQADEREQGSRALLNLGHSFAHAIERYTEYTSWLHGEAVAVGLICAAHVSRYQGYLNEKEVQSIRQLIQAFGLPLQLPERLDAATLVSLMQLDKKNRSNKLRLVLMRSLGNSFLTDEIQTDELAHIIEHEKLLK